jgi:hypothetical protein
VTEKKSFVTLKPGGGEEGEGREGREHSSPQKTQPSKHHSGTNCFLPFLSTSASGKMGTREY